MASDYAEIIWNEDYRVPSLTNNDICEYPLARNLFTLTVAVACEVIIHFTATQQPQSFTVTLGNFTVKPFLPSQS